MIGMLCLTGILLILTLVGVSYIIGKTLLWIWRYEL